MPLTLDLDADGTSQDARMPGIATFSNVTLKRGTIPAEAPDGPDVSAAEPFAPECTDEWMLFT